MEREKGTKKKYESPRKENNVTRWEERGRKRGAMAALAYYARRETAPNVFETRKTRAPTVH